MSARIPFAWLSEKDPVHLQEVLAFATNLDLLESLTMKEVRKRLMEEFVCIPATNQKPGGVITKWGQAVGREDPRTGSAWRSFDEKAMLLDIGPEADFVLSTLVEDIRHPTREELRRICTLHENYVLQDYHQTLRFRSWVDQCAAKGSESQEGKVWRFLKKIFRWE